MDDASGVQVPSHHWRRKSSRLNECAPHASESHPNYRETPGTFLQEIPHKWPPRFD